MTTPDAIEPAVGWRAWDVVELDGAYRLCSLAFWTIWLPAAPAVAACRRMLVDRSWSRLPDHAAPHEQCTCGIYATLTASQVLDYARRFRPRSDTVHRIAGRVSLWGAVVECEGGWRAAQAYPSALFVPSARGRRGLAGRLPRPSAPVDAIALGLADYSVPVEIVDASTWRELAGQLEPRHRFA
jgi:hypothetical protein